MGFVQSVTSGYFGNDSWVRFFEENPNREGKNECKSDHNKQVFQLFRGLNPGLVQFEAAGFEALEKGSLS